MEASFATFEGFLKRDRALVLGALAALVALSWAVLALMALDMDEGAAAEIVSSWTPGYFAATFFMWVVMMAGMMLPSAAPAILLFAALRRHGGGDPAVPTASFAAGYVLAWSAFSVLATAMQWALSTTALLSAAGTSDSAPLAGALFVLAGVYQLSPLKDACLGQCRSPAAFLVRRRREGATGALRMGFEHGLYCIGCCWALMLLLFAFGVMNLLWVAAITAFVLLEKLLPSGRKAAPAAAFVLLVLGVWLLNI